jgi:hypothetical protein
LTISKERIEELLQSIPGAKRASIGIIFPIDDNNSLPISAFKKEELEGRIMGEKFGSEFHLRNIYTKDIVAGLLPEEEFYLEFCSFNEIFRIRDLKNSHDYLLRLRANSISDDARAVRLMCQRRETFESKGKKWTLSHYYHQKDFYHKSYISMLHREKSKLLKAIPSGLAHIPDANALCIRSLAGDVVLVSEKLEMFYYFMSIAFYGDHFGLDWTDKKDALIIAVRIITGAETHDFEMDPRCSLPLKAEKGIRGYVNYQMKFTFGHEYSHYLLNHLDEAEVLSRSFGNRGSRSEDVAIYNHELEYEADYYSLKNIQHNKNEFGGMAHGAFSSLFFLHFIDECLNKLKMKKLSVSSTHPRSSDRIQELHKRLGKTSPINQTIIDEMFEVSDSMLGIIDIAKKQRTDMFRFYGSIHMSNYVTSPPQDRVMY